jgi:hypothetical protein
MTPWLVVWCERRRFSCRDPQAARGDGVRNVGFTLPLEVFADDAEKS